MAIFSHPLELMALLFADNHELIWWRDPQNIFKFTFVKVNKVFQILSLGGHKT